MHKQTCLWISNNLFLNKKTLDMLTRVCCFIFYNGDKELHIVVWVKFCILNDIILNQNTDDMSFQISSIEIRLICVFYCMLTLIHFVM